MGLVREKWFFSETHRGELRISNKILGMFYRTYITQHMHFVRNIFHLFTDFSVCDNLLCYTH